MLTSLGPADRHRSVATAFTHVVEAVVDWDAPSPVEAWTARDVVDHLVSWFPGFLAGGGVTLPAGPAAADDPVAAWWHQADAVQGLVDAPDADRSFTHPHAGTHPLDQAVDRFYTADVFMHTWDLGRAAGLEVRLDPDWCAEILAGSEAIEGLMRGSGQYGPRVEVPSDADAQTRLLGFIGRDPFWTA